MAKLYFKYGAMGSCKTAQALTTKFNYEERGMSVWLIKPAIDTRDGQGTVKSRIGLSATCEPIEKTDDLYSLYKIAHNEIDVIIADECQFFSEEQIDQLRHIVDECEIPVLCFGLRTDFLCHLFPGSKRLFEIADSISEIKTICACGSKATVNARLDGNMNVVTEGAQVMIGGNETYIAMCHRCWHEKIQSQKIRRTNMNIKEILSKCDHTLLAQGATWNDIKAICDDGMKYQTASVCIPASHVKQAKEYVGSKLQICTVIGFPNGYSTTAVKVFECKDALENGADEIDTVINIGDLKAGLYDKILYELKALKEACGEKILKVIIETCLLTDEEKIKMCELVTASGADFIKTSTGFSTAGATKEDVALFAKHIGKGVQIKAAGGISSLSDAEDFINLGATRLGTSRIVKIAKNEESNSSY